MHSTYLNMKLDIMVYGYNMDVDM